jgi:hypothetical protein
MMIVTVIFAGAIMVLALRARVKGSKFFKPPGIVLMQAGFIVVDKNACSVCSSWPYVWMHSPLYCFRIAAAGKVRAPFAGVEHSLLMPFIDALIAACRQSALGYMCIQNTYPQMPF